MSLTDKLSDGLETIAQQAQKALEQGKVRVEQLQVERRMDTVARRLGYMEFDAHRGRSVDQKAKDELLEELVELEEELHSSLAAAGSEEGAAGGTRTTPSPGTDMAEAERIAKAAAEAGVQPGAEQVSPNTPTEDTNV